MATVTERATETFDHLAEPARAVVHDHLRDIRRAAVTGRQSLETCATEARVQVRRYPFLFLAVAAGAGTVVGILAAWVAGRQFVRTARE